MRQEGHELPVVPLMEIGRGAGEFVALLAPRIALGDRGKGFGMTLYLIAAADRHQPQRPHQDLAEMTCDG